MKKGLVRGGGVCVFACAVAFGQGTASFEVASVKVSPPVSETARVYFGPPRGGPGTDDPGQITWTYALLKAVLMTAYDVKAYQVSGPAWLTTERYDITAKVPAGATKEQVRSMWQRLLAERFGMALHVESREMPVEELVVAKGGLRMKETAQDFSAPLPEGPPQVKNGELVSPGVVVSIYPGPPPKAHAMGRAQPISQLTAMLSSQINRPVLDKTGLTGKYDFTLDYAPGGVPLPAPPAAGDGASDPVPDLAAAVQQELGLRLVAARAKIDVMVIDKAEKVPTSN
jgi:uncharacterized protein (TIGR03435 family)